MCEVKSVIILKDRIFIHDSNSHRELLEKLGIEDTRENAERLFVRAELTPQDGDIFSDISKWHFRVDQDILPDWFVLDYDKERVIEAVREWASEHIHIDKQDFSLQTGKHYVKNCKNFALYDNSVVEYMCGNSVVKSMNDNSVVECMYGNSVAKSMNDNSVVESMYGDSAVKSMNGDSAVKYMYGDSVVKSMNGDSVVKSMNGNSVVESMNGDSAVESMYGNSVVESMNGDSAVKYMNGNSVVKSMNDDSVVKCMYDNSVVESMNGDSAVKYMYGNSVVKSMNGNSVVKCMNGNSMAIATAYHCFGKFENLTISGNANFKDCKNKINYHSRDWESAII